MPSAAASTTLIELLTREIAVRPRARAAPHTAQSSSHDSAPHAATICCISTSIGCVRNLQPIQLAGAHLADQRAVLHQIVARGRKQPALRNRAAPVPCSAHALHRDRHRARRGNLAHQVDVADIDAELQRSRRNQNPNLAILQPLLGIQPQRARQRPMMRRDALRPKPRRQRRTLIVLHKACACSRTPASTDARALAPPACRRSPPTSRSMYTEPSSSDGTSIARSSVRRCPTCTIVAALRSGAAPDKKVRNQLNRILRRRKPDALRRLAHARSASLRARAGSRRTPARPAAPATAPDATPRLSSASA